MTRVDDSLFLPNPDEIKSIPEIKDWMKKVQGMLNSNQSDLKQDLDERIDDNTGQQINGEKSFSNLKLSASMNCNKKQLISLVIENRTSDPTDPEIGQIWLRTDLL